MDTRRQRLTVAVAAAGLALGAVGAGVLQASSAAATPATASVAGGGPAGNAGTIKINTLPLGSAPRNEPHLTCDLAVSFHGYAGGSRTATLTFEAQPPTAPAKGSRLILRDTLTFAGGKGGSTLDATKAYRLDLTGLPVQPKQGVHVKLTVNVPGSRGADVKHKVFWVGPCVAAPGPKPTPTPSHPAPTPTVTIPAGTPAPTPTTTPTTGVPAPTPTATVTVGVPAPSPSTSTVPAGAPATPGTGGPCTGAAAASPDCTTVSGPPHFTG